MVPIEVVSKVLAVDDVTAVAEALTVAVAGPGCGSCCWCYCCCWCWKGGTGGECPEGRKVVADEILEGWQARSC